MKTAIKIKSAPKKSVVKKSSKSKDSNSYSNAYKDFIKDVKEFNIGNFKPSKRGLVTVNLGGL